MAKKNEKSKSFLGSVFFILALGFVIRLFLASFGTLPLDFNTFVAWSVRLAESGLRSFYESWSDYFPGYLYVLWVLGKLKALAVIPPVLLYKLPAIIADIATGYLVYKIVKKSVGKRLGFLASAAYIFNPAVFANSTLWGQVDSFTALFSVLAVYFTSKRWYLSSAFLVLGTLIKPQAALAAPVIFLQMIKKKWKLKEIFIYILLSALVFLVAFIPFSSGGNFFTFVLERVSASLGQYPYTSVNAFNFWGLFGFWKSDSIFPSVFGLVLVTATTFFVGRKVSKEKGWQYTLLATIFVSGFIFLTRMHERHLLPAFAPLAIASALNPALWVVYFGLSFTYLANLYYSFNWITHDFSTVFSPGVIAFLIIANLLALGLMLFVFSGKKIQNLFSKANKSLTNSFSKISLSKGAAKRMLLLILTFSLVTRLLALGSPKEEYFDEVYHAFTARRILHGDPKAWEWWNTPPEGFAYEWTHPPFAKLAMAGGMKIFGENSFGWRFPGVIFGTTSIFLVYLIAKKIFKDEALSLFSAAIFALEGLVLVMSRIGMNDIYLLTFSLAAIYLFLRDKTFLSALSFGLALSSKWSAVWGLPILFAAHLVFKKKVKKGYLWFLLLPFTVYLITYLPMFLTNHGLDIFIGVQKQMWWYHTGLVAEHAYTSSWLSWPFLIRPIYLYTSAEVGGFVSRIYAMGNPFVFWFGLPAMVYCSYLTLVKKNKELGFLVFSYLVFFVPWAASPRIMFLYHYLPSLPFLAMASAFVLRKYLHLAPYYLLLTTLLFLYFYPHLTGLSVPEILDLSYYWFPSWR